MSAAIGHRYKGTWRALTPALAMAVTASGAVVGARAQALFESPVGFKVNQPCQAYTGIKRRDGVMNVRAGDTFEALGENAATGGAWVYLTTPGSRRWLPLSCGNYEGQRPPFRQAASAPERPGKAPPQAACLPFFDELDNPVRVGNGAAVDITPPAPALDAFDQAVNQVCGASGNQTTQAGFVLLMRAHPQVLGELMRFTGGKVFATQPVRTDPGAYLQDLSRAWYAAHAFDHIFCGETEGERQIGGLHFHGRYQQLQRTGEACRLPNSAKNEVLPGRVYSMGVKMKRRDGTWITHDIKGHGLSLSAADMLKAATRAFAENPGTGRDSQACLLPVQDGQAHYSMVFVRRQQGIRTIYPDATPDTARTPACRAGWALD